MTPAQFHELDCEEQMLEIFHHATELAVREDAEHRYHLYKLHDFYVEKILHKNIVQGGENKHLQHRPAVALFE